MGRTGKLGVVAVRRVVGRVVAVAFCLGLAGCSFAGSGTGLGGASTPTTSSPGAAAPSTEPSPGSVSAELARLAELARTAGTPVAAGAVTLTVGADSMPVAASVQDDGSVVLAIAVAASDERDPSASSGANSAGPTRRVAAVVAAPAGLTFESASDGSVSLRGPGAGVAGALARSRSADGAGVGLSADLAAREGDATLLDVYVDGGEAGEVAVLFGANPLVSAGWGEREGGRSLAVVPAAWVRSGSLAAQDALWSAVVAAEPDADSTTMHDQLTCHALGAPDKDSWNLEPWRPEVDSITLLASRCNPEP